MNSNINKILINNLLENNEIQEIERHLIYFFVQNNNLDFIKNSFLLNYFQDFELNPSLYLSVSSLEIPNLKILENYLELLIPLSDRKLNGAFFTPAYVVDFIINETNPQEKDKCLDPSCGGGAFLIGLVDYYRKKYNKSIKKIIQENIYGSDILDYNAKRAQLILCLYGLLFDEIIEENDFNIHVQDSLKAEWKTNFDIIVGNPPYVKYQDLSDENRLYLCKKWKTIDNGTFNLYFAFFELGYNLLTENGKLGYITPNNYFTSLSGLSLRTYFLNTKSLTRVIDFSYKKVFDAQTYTAISFLNKKENESILYDKIKENQECEEFLNVANGSPNYIENLNAKKWRLLKSDEQKNIKSIETIGTAIKNLFTIAVGIATLKDEVFFVDSANQEEDFLIKTTENGIFRIEKEITQPVYKISKFKSQKEIENNTLRIITPYYTNSKTAIPILEEEFQAKYPNCYAYLLSEKKKLGSRDKGKKNYSPFYVWARTQGITRFGKKILNPTFSKKPRFLLVEEENAYYTNGYGIYFNKDNSTTTENSLFVENTHFASQEKNILLVQKILNSVVMEYYINKTSVSIQGGFPCYQKNFIEKFTIPNFSNSELEILKLLSDKNEIDSFLVEKYQLNIPLPNLVS